MPSSRAKSSPRSSSHRCPPSLNHRRQPSAPLIEKDSGSAGKEFRTQNDVRKFSYILCVLSLLRLHCLHWFLFPLCLACRPPPPQRDLPQHRLLLRHVAVDALGSHLAVQVPGGVGVIDRGLELLGLAGNALGDSRGKALQTRGGSEEQPSQ